MSLRDLAVMGAVYGTLPVIPLSPFFGLLVYSWLAYMRPQDLAWGIASEQRLSFYVALAIFIGLLVRSGRERLLTLVPQSVLLLAFLGWITVCHQLSVLPDVGAADFSNYWKAILVALLTTGLVRSFERFRLLMLVIAGSLGLLALKYTAFALVRGGARFNDGPGGFMGDNNGFASALVMLLPLLSAIVAVEQNKWLRMAAGALAASTVLTILFTFSRGGLLSLAVVGALLMLRSRHRMLAGFALVLALFVFFRFTNEEVQTAYADRVSSIAEYQEDRSATGRLDAWQTAYRVFTDNPVFGVGPGNFMIAYSRRGDPDSVRVAHNTYLQLLAECGAPGLLLFLALFVVTGWRLERLRKNAEEPEWVRVWASMLQISLAGFLAASLTLNRGTFDLVYHLIGIAAALELSRAVARSGATTEPDVPWYRRPLAAS